MKKYEDAGMRLLALRRMLDKYETECRILCKEIEKIEQEQCSFYRTIGDSDGSDGA